MRGKRKYGEFSKLRCTLRGESSQNLLATESQFTYFGPRVKKQLKQTFVVLEGQCAGPEVCPLSRVQAGVTVCIQRLSTAPEVKDRLRELGLCEKQKIKLLARQSTFICQVCNARLGISQELADAIWVEALPATAHAT